ncbi:MAG: DUF4363 family protein [Firmicutes bacterium]|jgi:hypothetical protein|nr:DUF4363 family protein [Bacillota bacterium]
MKAAVGISILLVVLVGTSLLIYSLTGSLYLEMKDCLDTMEKAVENGQWGEVEKEASLLQELWHRGDCLWSPVMDHRQIDRVDESITLIMALVKMKSKENLVLEINAARRMLKRIKDKESPLFKTIF